WRWKTSQEAARYLAHLRAFDIDWIEDPFPVELIDCYRQFQRFERVVPVGAGDDLTYFRDVEALMEAPVDVLRLDALSIGGVTAFGELAAAAKKRGCAVSPHFYPQIHQHCVFGWGASDHVEMIPSDRPFDRTHELIRHDAFARVKNGRLAAPGDIGAGYELDDEAVERSARRKTVAG
ncbi:MAG: enolase C-terminal domain-like protein, partial [Parvibaculaceae bacterium]